MTQDTATYLVAAVCGLIGLGAWIGLVLVPAWTAYSKVWERVAAAFLSLYVATGAMILGVGLAAFVVWSWDRWTG